MKNETNEKLSSWAEMAFMLSDKNISHCNYKAEDARKCHLSVRKVCAVEKKEKGRKKNRKLLMK
jgi:hypothetical protein